VQTHSQFSAKVKEELKEGTLSIFINDEKAIEFANEEVKIEIKDSV